MALLAGGQRVRQLVLAARPPGAGDAGTSLFVFHVRSRRACADARLSLGAQEDVEELKREYRAALNALGAGLTEKDIQKACDTTALCKLLCRTGSARIGPA